MAIEPAWIRWSLRLTLPSLRATVRSGPYRRLWALAAIAFVVISMFVGQMILVFLQDSPFNHEPIHVTTITSLGQVSNPYLVPAVIVTAPHLVLSFAFWPTLVMGLLGAGIGLAVSSSVALFAVQRRRRMDLAASGVAPVVTGAALLGACCCTTCVAQAATIGLIGAASGTSAPVLISSSWPLGLFQLLILGASLLYMERELEGTGAPSIPVPASDRRRALAVALRIALLLGAITWLFSFVVEWSAAEEPITTALLYHWALEHWALGLIGIVSALGPLGAWSWFGRHAQAAWGIRAVLLLAGVTWGIYVPPFAADWGLGGTVNEMMGYVGAPAAWGAVAPDAPLGGALLFHWIFQHTVIAAWGIAVSLAPARAFAVLSPDRRPAPDWTPDADRSVRPDLGDSPRTD
ncbi:MAG TPA: hypothetical protein VIZ68_00255 [Thermoplasmata archaeon]